MATEQRLSSAERSDLVAYLDGELSEAESRAIATKLTRSVTARGEVDALTRTWELLDALPRPKASEDFTQRTLTEVDRLSVPGEAIAGVASATLRHGGRMLAWSLASAALFGLGLVLARWAWPDPTARLARDLPIAEHLDEYLDVRSIEFLDGLDGVPEFTDDPDY